MENENDTKTDATPPQELPNELPGELNAQPEPAEPPVAQQAEVTAEPHAEQGVEGAAAETAESVSEVASEPEVEAPKKRQRRSRKKAAAAPVEEEGAAEPVAVATAVVVEEGEGTAIAECLQEIEAIADSLEDTEEALLRTREEREEKEEAAVEEIEEQTETAEEAQMAAEPAGEPPQADIRCEKTMSAVESVLFASEKAVSMARFREVFGEEGPSDAKIKTALEAIKERYAHPSFGFELREMHGGYHFVTKIENAEWIRKFNQTKPFKVTRTALEVLAVIAYRQPVTRAEIDQVRGIDSSHLLRVLMERGLVQMAGKAEVPGRPVQYATTPKFLEVVGLASLSELPPLSELEQLQGDTQDPMKSLEEGLDRIISESRTAAEGGLGQESEGLSEIDSLIQSAESGAEKEVYESEVHAAVAEENKLALQAFQEVTREEKKVARAARKRMVSYEDLTSGGVPVQTPVVPPDEPETVN